MRLDVVFTPAGLATGELQGRAVFVVDILRAGTTICAALEAGARAVVPVASTEEALRMAQTLGAGDVVLAGERNCVRIPGFALGNSPAEMTPEAVRGKIVVMSTSNGTGALLAVTSGAQIHVAGACNFSVMAERARDAWAAGQEILVVCAGREQRFALDDAYTAGRIVEAAIGGGRGHKGLNDAARAALDLVRRHGRRWDRPLAASQGGRDLIQLGMKDDIALCAREDAYPAAAVFVNRRVVLQAQAERNSGERGAAP